MGSILAGLISPALTVATQAAGAYQGAESQAGQAKQQEIMQALSLRRQMHQQDIEDALHTAQTNNYIAQDNARQAAASKGDKLTAVRVALMRRNPEFADYSDDELAGLASDPTTFQQATGFGRSSGQFLRGTDANGNPVYGYGDRSTGAVTPTNFGAPPIRPASASGGMSPYSETMHNFNAVGHQLSDANRQLSNAQKSPLSIDASPADSAAKNQAIVAAVRRVKGLQPVEDSLSAAMRGDNSIPGHPSAIAPRVNSANPTAQEEYTRAAQALQAAGGPSNAEARAKYDRIIQAITDKYSRQ